MRLIRERKLHSLVKTLFDEAERLGYSVAEVQEVVDLRRIQPPDDKAD